MSESVRQRVTNTRRRNEELEKERVDYAQNIVSAQNVVKRQCAHIAFCLRNHRAIAIASLLPVGWRARFLQCWTLESIDDMRDLCAQWKRTSYS